LYRHTLHTLQNRVYYVIYYQKIISYQKNLFIMRYTDCLKFIKVANINKSSNRKYFTQVEKA